MARSKSISTIDNEISKITDEIIKLRRKEELLTEKLQELRLLAKRRSVLPRQRRLPKLQLKQLRRLRKQKRMPKKPKHRVR